VIIRGPPIEYGRRSLYNKERKKGSNEEREAGKCEEAGLCMRRSVSRAKNEMMKG